MKPRARILGTVVLVATLGAACSGGGSGNLTKPQLADQADAICARANRSISRMYRPDPLDAAATTAALAKVVTRQRAELRQLRALEPPTIDASDYGRWLTQIDLALARADVSRRAIARGDVQAADEANHRADQIRTDADRFAKGYGMHDCARR